MAIDVDGGGVILPLAIVSSFKEMMETMSCSISHADDGQRLRLS